MKLTSRPGQSTRPTGDRVKEALFNILGPNIQGCSFLDLYAGSGAIGLEALSRGAEEVIWVDADPACTSQIRANLEKTRLTDGQIITKDVQRALGQLERQGDRFDYIFLDPPYEQGLVHQTLELPSLLAILKGDGIIIAEASKKEEAPIDVSNLRLKREQRYGDTILLFYEPRRS